MAFASEAARLAMLLIQIIFSVLAVTFCVIFAFPGALRLLRRLRTQEFRGQIGEAHRRWAVRQFLRSLPPARRGDTFVIVAALLCEVYDDEGVAERVAGLLSSGVNIDFYVDEELLTREHDLNRRVLQALAMAATGSGSPGELRILAAPSAMIPERHWRGTPHVGTDGEYVRLAMREYPHPAGSLPTHIEWGPFTLAEAREAAEQVARLKQAGTCYHPVRSSVKAADGKHVLSVDRTKHQVLVA